MNEKEKAKTEFPSAKIISRKMAIKKAGIGALTVSGMIFLLGTQKSAAASFPTAPPSW